jgi:hypothetical protein
LKDVKSKVSYSADPIPITIATKASFNGNVSGIATLTIRETGSQVFRKEISINSTKKVLNVDMELDLGYSGDKVSNYDVELDYYDILTNSTVIDTKTLEILPKPYKILLSGDPFIIPDREFVYSVVVVKYDESPASAGTIVNIIVENLDITQTLELDERGSATSTINVPVDANFILIKATSDDAIEAVLNVTLPLSNSGHGHEKKKDTMRIDVVTKR